MHPPLLLAVAPCTAFHWPRLWRHSTPSTFFPFHPRTLPCLPSRRMQLQLWRHYMDASTNLFCLSLYRGCHKKGSQDAWICWGRRAEKEQEARHSFGDPCTKLSKIMWGWNLLHYSQRISGQKLRLNAAITRMTQPKSVLVVGPFSMVVGPFSAGNQRSLVLNASWSSPIGYRRSCRPTT